MRQNVKERVRNKERLSNLEIEPERKQNLRENKRERNAAWLTSVFHQYSPSSSHH